MINKITRAEFTDYDISIWQENSLVLLTREEILELAKEIKQENEMEREPK